MINEIYFFLVVLTSILVAGLALYGLRRRDTPGSLAFAVMSFVTLWWPLNTAITMALPPEQGPLFYETLRYPFIAFIPVTFLLFILKYLGRDEWMEPKRIAMLSIIPTISVIMILTNDAHQLFVDQFTYVSQGGYTVPLETDYGPWYWVHAGYSYILIMTGFVLVGVRLFRTQPTYRQQIGWMFGAILIPAVVNVMDMFNVIPGLMFPMAPIGFGAMALLSTVALFRYRMLDVMPVARDAVIEGMDDLVIVVDPQNRIVDVNSAVERRIDVQAREVIGQPIEEVFKAQQDLIEHYKQMEDAHDEVRIGGVTYDFSLSTLRQQDGRVIGRLLVMRDITDRKQAEEERERLIAELNAYAQTVAHDLKNPLNVILNYAHLIEVTQENPSEQLQKYTSMIKRSGKRSVNIIDELLLLATVREQDEVPMEPLDMGEIVTEAQDRLHTMIADSGATIKTPAAWPRAVGYGPWVEEVWVNYLSNAVKYGGEPPEIRLGAEQTGDQVRFWVKDNGKGLTEEERHQLFAEFTRLDREKAQGHGLGLSIVHRIVRRLGGKVGVQSEIGKGSVFYFVLPAAQPDRVTGVA